MIDNQSLMEDRIIDENFNSRNHLSVAILIYIVLTVTSIIGNVIVLYTFYQYPVLRVPSNLFIVNLAITDLINALSRNQFILIGLIVGSKPYTILFCDVSGFINSLGHVVMIGTLTSTAVCRYLVIVHSYGKKITFYIVRRIILLVWLYAILGCAMPWFGWNRYIYQPTEFTCLPDWNDENNFSYILYILIFDTIIPCIILFLCYWRIHAFICSNANRMLVHVNQSFVQTAHHQSWCILIKNEIKITKLLFILCLLFMICILPYTIVIFILIPCGIHISPYIAFYCGVLINLNSSLNPLLYPTIYPKIRKTYHHLGCCLCQHAVRIHQESSRRRAVISPLHSCNSIKIEDTRTATVDYDNS